MDNGSGQSNGEIRRPGEVPIVESDEGGSGAVTRIEGNVVAGMLIAASCPPILFSDDTRKKFVSVADGLLQSPNERLQATGLKVVLAAHRYNLSVAESSAMISDPDLANRMVKVMVNVDLDAI